MPVKTGRGGPYGLPTVKGPRPARKPRPVKPGNSGVGYGVGGTPPGAAHSSGMPKPPKLPGGGRKYGQ